METPSENRSHKFE
nr:hypothetical protein [Streptococcus oralis]MBU6872852.1 hypothetical protein [Streptococcus oralis]